jgi:hypothetical protein
MDEELVESYSDVGQDTFVKNILDSKKDGYFLEIGSGWYNSGNNTYLFEKDYNWKGIMIDSNGKFLEGYEKYRYNSTHIIGDATTLNYKEELDKSGFPKDLDYLSFDLIVRNKSTLNTLNLLDSQIFDTYRFAVITFEHDIHQNWNGHNETRLKSREIFKKRNYVCVFHDVAESQGGPINPFEDWYVHSELVDMDYVRHLQELNKNHYKEGINTGDFLALEYKAIKYPTL